MSTYSWSYKVASHRQSSAKRAQTEQDDLDKNGVYQSERDKSVVLHSSSSQDNSTGTTKRLNWKAKIYVGNLNKKTNEASLAYYFSVFGDIEDIKLIRDHDTKESRGFAFITFEKIESAEKAKKWCSFNYPSLDDNNITVASAERKTHKFKISKNEQLAKRDPTQTLFWEFKWTNSDEAQVYGPYETSLMQAWKNQGYFSRGCWVRQVCHRQISKAGEIEQAKTNICEGNVKNENCGVVPCKKPKLMIDYSDSDEESEDTADIGGVTLDVGGQSRDREGNNEVIVGNKVIVEGREGCERSKTEVMGGEEVEMEKRQREDENKKTKESLKILDDTVGNTKGGEKKVDPSKEYKATEGLNLSRKHQEANYEQSMVEMKDDETMSSGILPQNEYAHLILPENDRQNDFSLNKVHSEPGEGYHKLSTIKTKHEDVESKDLGLAKEVEEESIIEENLRPIVEDPRECTKDEKDALVSRNDMLEQYQGQMVEEDEQTENIICQGNLRSIEADHKQSISNTSQGKGNYDILQLYEERHTVLPENDYRDKQKINDEDLRQTDDSSSEEEDFENNTDDISTEFVAVTEIDFNLYP